MKIRRLSTRQAGFDAKLAALTRYEAAQDAKVSSVVRAIIAAVRKRGDAAVLAYTRRFDRVRVASVAKLEVGRKEMRSALESLPATQARSLRQAAVRIRRFHQRQLSRSWKYADADGTQLGQIVTPLERVGIYVPGGKAAYPSSVLMNAIPAKVAGVPEVVMVSPNPNSMVLAAAAIAGVDRVIAIGGAQAVAALAYGTRSVPRVDKIVGPGNAYVAEAKRQVFGQVGIDLIAGPSEILVVADNKNDPAWIAADLLSQAEHDPSSQSVLIAQDHAFADAVARAVEAELKTMKRAEIAGASWRDNGAIILVPDLAHSAPIIDRIAAEHVELAMEMAPAEALSQKIRHAGAIFLGRHTPEAIGDYVAGTNHVLPTSRAARFSGGLGVSDFLKRTSLVSCTPDALAALGPAALALAGAEGLEAHGRSISIRLNRRT